ncbi:MAG: lycopene cyclase [Deltaproteobacteria bacterium]|nr:lycopene cyclase [Deltaproteobacteria bacterium]
MQTDFDYVIVGAGCGGLSLAVHLLEAGVRRRVLIVDPRTSFAHDRTWCFYDVTDHPFADAVSHEWRRWRVVDEESEVVRGSDRFAYQHISSADFYAAAQDRIRRAPTCELRLGTRVERVLDNGSHVVVTTDAGPVTARLVFDSRPSEARVFPGAGADTREVNLLQHFVGWTVETKNPFFDPDTATLMDFRTSQRNGIHFTYTLPFSPRRALVEDTYFSSRRLEAKQYEANLRRYLDEAGAGDFVITHTERGAIPMTTAVFEQRPSPRVYRIGVAGGLARPATGYAFLAIQRFSKNLAEILAAAGPGAAPEPPAPRSPRTTILDRCFLSHLDQHPKEAPAIFTRLFDRVPPDALIAFLSETGSFADELHVMRSLPTLPFAQSMLRALYGLVRRRGLSDLSNLSNLQEVQRALDDLPPRAQP